MVINELVYVKQPPGFEDPNFPNHVYKLDKALYGLKQAPCTWYEHLRELLFDRGFEVGKIDPTLFTKKVNGELFVCQIYVDDIIFGSSNKAFNDELSKLMTSRFRMSLMGELRVFLGFEIKQVRGGTFFNQAKYTQDMLKRFKMQDLNGAPTPMATKTHLEQNPNGKDVDQKVYRSMIGSLLYLCASRPDIVLSVGVCARYQAAPKESHLMAVKKIFRYLVHTPFYGLWYPRGSTLLFVDTRIRIGQVTRMIENQHPGLANSLVGPWYVGLPRNKIAYLSPPPKPSMWQLLVLAPNCYG